MKRLILTFSYLIIGCLMLQAQSAIAVTGAGVSNETGSVSYTVGQVAYTAVYGEDGSVSQGVQQVYDITTFYESTLNDNIDNISVFPNPTEDRLYIQIENKSNSVFHFDIIDAEGKIILSKRDLTELNEINTSYLKPAVYFISVFENENIVKTFKVVKNK